MNEAEERSDMRRKPKIDIRGHFELHNSKDAIGERISDSSSIQLLGGVCVECRINRCEGEDEDYCKKCWQKFKDEGNAERIRKIKEGWTVDSTGGIHPPNATNEALEKGKD